MKKLFTLYIGIIFLNVSFAQANSNDSILQKEFDLFEMEMKKYSEANDPKIYSITDSSAKALDDCKNYHLVWVIEKDWPKNQIKRGDSLNELCGMVYYFKKVNESTLGDSSKYGLWYYHFSVIGKKYFIIDGDQAVGREVHRYYYYVRKDK